MRGVGRAVIRMALVAIAIGTPAHAQVAPTLAPAIVWYRSSEGCPDGAAFLAKLGEKASLARLAGSGDRVDFVVTLGVSPDGSQGRLERQTSSGTVAIRELHDPSCSNVADALALSLALALDPEARGAESGPDNAPTPSKPDTSRVDASPSPVSPPPPPPSPTPITPSEPTRSLAAPRWTPAAGFDAGVVTGVLPGVLPRADAFIEVHASASGPSLRGGAVVITGSSHADAGDLRLWIAAAGFDGCPVALGSDAVRVSIARTPNRSRVSRVTA